MDSITMAIVMGVGIPMISGGIYALFKVWKNSVTKEEVSQQISTECRYVKDQAVICDSLNRHEKAIEKAGDAIQDVLQTQTLHTGILERIERGTQQMRSRPGPE